METPKNNVLGKISINKSLFVICTYGDSTNSTNSNNNLLGYNYFFIMIFYQSKVDAFFLKKLICNIFNLIFLGNLVYF